MEGALPVGGEGHMVERVKPEAVSEMLADALVDEGPSTDLLLQYSRDPGSMDPEDERRVEEYLAESPAHLDRFKVLQNLALFQEIREAVSRAHHPTSEAPTTAALLAAAPSDTGGVADRTLVDQATPAQESGIRHPARRWIVSPPLAIGVGLLLLLFGALLGYWLG